MTLTLLHASDLQIGKPYRSHVADALVRTVDEEAPDIVVIAGDLTQRAKASEYRVARALLSRLGDRPVVVTPGNHDVPLYRVWERLVAPYRNWKRYIAAELDSVLDAPGAKVVALNSSAPRRAIVAGRLDASQIAFARTAFAEARPEQLRILVVHHHFVETDDGSGGRPLPGAKAHLSAFAGMGVDLLLGGHVHHTRILGGDDVRTGVSFPLVSCGTTTSHRGRGSEAGLNTFNLIRISPEDIRVTPHRFVPERERFEPANPTVVTRGRRAGVMGEGSDDSVEGSRGGG
ncbi:MAG: metallophosphoesterase [Gemmatimonadota bacterium]|nr:metallophosphoesterase [Gemmatimonadota bacterium]